MRFWLAWLIYYWGGIHRYFGITNGVRREFERAVSCYERALSLEPDFRDARLALAKIRGRELGEVEKGVADLNVLIGKKTNDGDALLARAQFFQELGRYEAALKDLEAYLRLPNQPHQDLAARSVSYIKALLSGPDE